MIHEPAHVSAYESGRALLEFRQDQASACASCKLRSGCGQGLLATMRRSSAGSALEFPVSTPLEPGESVTLSISDRQILLGSLWVYGVPLLALVAGAVVGSFLDEGGDFGTGMGILIGLFLSAVVLRMADRLPAIRIVPDVDRGPRASDGSPEAGLDRR